MLEDHLILSLEEPMPMEFRSQAVGTLLFILYNLTLLAVADPGFPVGGGVDLRCRCFSPKMYAKMKELGPIGAVRRARPPRSANDSVSFKKKVSIHFISAGKFPEMTEDIER